MFLIIKYSEVFVASLIPVSGSELINRFACNLNKEFKGERDSFDEIIVLLSRYSYRPDIRTQPIEDKIAHTWETIANDKKFQKNAEDRWQKDLKALSKLTKFVNDNRADLSALIGMNKTDYDRAVKTVYEQNKEFRIMIPEILVQKSREESRGSIQAPRPEKPQPKDDGCSIM